MNNIIRNNSISSISKCLIKLFHQLDSLQQNIESMYFDFHYLNKNLIRAVRDHSTLLSNLVVFAHDSGNLFNNLQTAIVNYKTVHKSSTHNDFVQSYNEKKKDKNKNETFYINCQYRENKSRMRDRKNFSRFQQNIFNKSLARRLFFRQKKCFVCDKIECWSNNHTQQKRDEFKKNLTKVIFTIAII